MTVNQNQNDENNHKNSNPFCTTIVTISDALSLKRFILLKYQALKDNDIIAHHQNITTYLSCRFDV